MEQNDTNSIKNAVSSLTSKGYKVHEVETGSDALTKIKEIIPEGASVMNGSSATLAQIGYIEYLKSGDHGWKNLHEEILNESDPEKQAVLRKQALLSDFYLGSVHALAESGEFVIGSNTGSQLPHIVYSSKNLIFVVSVKKIVKNVEECLKRLREVVVPLENARIQKAYQVDTALNKIVFFEGENPSLHRQITFLIVNEDLGF